MPTAALACETQLIHGSPFRRLRSVLGEVGRGGIRASVLLLLLLYKSLIGQPAGRDCVVAARHTTNRNQHCAGVCLVIQEHFICSVLTKMLASARDVQTSIAVIGLFAILSIVGIPHSVLDAILTRGILSRGIWIAAVLFLLYTKFYLTAVLVTVLGLYLSFNAHSDYAFSHDGVLAAYSEAQKHDPRFASDELDVSMANGTLQVDPARWEDPGREPIPLLLFPPTEAQLAMAADNGHSG